MFSDDSRVDMFQPFISAWYKSLDDPDTFQKQLLLTLLQKYAKTQYGITHNSSDLKSIDDYQKAFPIMNYADLLPYLLKVQQGNYKAILSEPAVCWVMTRGSTGSAKVLPATQTHLKQVFSCGARALLNYVMRQRDFNIINGHIINLNFPSRVHTMNINGRKVTYGYSSGTYARLNPMLDKVSLIPRQEKIDDLGTGISKSDWEKRFELVYQEAIHGNVTAAMGVTPVILSFGQYIQKKHGQNPKELWNLRALFCTSVRKIPIKYTAKLRKYYGNIPIVEIYSATEGVFAQQLDSLPYVTPNYDTYFFEVKTRQKIKMLHELKRGEWGKLIISSCMFPRYDIGDVIEAAGKNYFRIVGRYRKSTLIEHILYRSVFKWFL